MKAQATALIPFVPAGADFALALAFFAELGFATAWKHDGLAGLRFGPASSSCRRSRFPSGRRTRC